MKIVVAICTHRRPTGLERLLRSLGALDPVVLDDGAPLEFEAVVIDNDAGGAGLATAERLAATLPFGVFADLTTSEGLSAARNRAVQRALERQPDLVAFLDDDEWPEPVWLAELVRVQRRFDADAVGGPTRSVFPQHARPEQVANPYYGADLGLADGAACTLEAGGNFLMRAATLRALGPEPFDPAFARSGGEDLAFFTALAQRGTRMRWAARAMVNESVPPDRLDDGWMRQRVINIANARVRVMQRLERSVAAATLRGIKTIGLGGVALLLSVAGLVSPGVAERARLLRWKFQGKASAHLGLATERKESY